MVPREGLDARGFEHSVPAERGVFVAIEDTRLEWEKEWAEAVA